MGMAWRLLLDVAVGIVVRAGGDWRRGAADPSAGDVLQNEPAQGAGDVAGDFAAADWGAGVLDVLEGGGCRPEAGRVGGVGISAGGLVGGSWAVHQTKVVLRRGFAVMLMVVAVRLLFG